MNVLKLAGGVKNPSGFFSKFIGFFTGTGSAAKHSQDYQKALFKKKLGEKSDQLIELQTNKNISKQQYADMQSELVDVSNQKTKGDIKDLIIKKQKEVGYKLDESIYDRTKQLHRQQSNSTDKDYFIFLETQEQIAPNKTMLKSDEYKKASIDQKFSFLEKQAQYDQNKKTIKKSRAKQYKDYYLGGTKVENAKHIAGQSAKTAIGVQAVAQPIITSKKLYEGQQRDREKRQERKQSIMSMTNFSMYKPQSYRQRIINIINQGMR